MSLPDRLPIGAWVERGVEWLLDHGQRVFDAAEWVIGSLVRGLESALLAVPMWLGAAILVALAVWRRSLRFGAFAALALALVAGMDLYDQLMSTMALVLASTLMGLLVGLPLGVAAARSDRIDRLLRPVLDFMQTMPAFVYLIPAAMLFGLGRVPGVVATFIFAMPPAVRLTNLGIRQVPTELVEAGLAFGCTERQLLVRVQIPSALPSIMAGVNQTIMLSLSMVVIASMIGAGGLGDEVLRGIQRLDVGLGFEAGLAVVLLAILLDRVTESFAEGERKTWRERWDALRDDDRLRTRRVALQAVALSGVVVGLIYVARLGMTSAAAPAPQSQRTAQPEQRGEPTRALRVGWTAWSDAEVVAHLVERLMQRRLSQPVELTMADIGIQYQGVASGELDVMIMAWLPTTHAPYWEKVAGNVTDLGPLYTRARLGWVVPDYVPESEVATIGDLAKPAVSRRLGGRIQGIDPGSGLMQASERALSHYGLSSYQLVSASGAGMAAAIQRAYRNGDWIVATAWSPHWLFARYDLRYLSDPDHVLGGRERIHALARRGFYQDFPIEVSELLMRMHLPLEEIEALMLDATEGSVDAAIDGYIASHEARIDYWVTGELQTHD